jgi:predicted GNAT superfamily acetyltransferase
VPPDTVPPIEDRLLLVEIPSDFMSLKALDLAVARQWRLFSRQLFETAFARGFIVTDFVFDEGRGLYVLTHGESTLEQFE